MNPKEGIVLADIPETSGLFLERPISLVVDREGRFYGLDLGAETVFVWDKKGKFLFNFGQSGKGPGEFKFYPVHETSVHAAILKDRYVVYDGVSHVLHFFKLDGTFDKAVPFSVKNGSPDSFFASGKNNLVLLNIMAYAQDPYSEVLLFDRNLEQKRMLLKRPDDVFSARRRNGKFIGYNYEPFAPRTAVFADPLHEEIIVGANERTEFHVFSLKGRLQRTVRYKAKPLAVTEEERKAVLDSDWIKNVNVKIKYDDFFPHYSFIFPVKDKGYLIGRMLMANLKIDCIFIDRNGNTLGRYVQKLGDEGAIYGAAGRILLQLDDGESVTFREILFD